jgi:hypothetical protein
MKAAFCLFLAAPAPGARVFPDLHRRRTGHAADRDVVSFIQRVEGNISLLDVGPNLFGGPKGEF